MFANVVIKNRTLCVKTIESQTSNVKKGKKSEP